MGRKGIVVLLLGFVIVVSGWWLIWGSSLAQPKEDVVDVWATWGDGADHLQALFDRFTQTSGVRVRVTTRVGSKDLLEALAGPDQPDMVILSNSDLVAIYAGQGLVEPLDGWIEASAIDLAEFYPAPLGQCRSPDGAYLCLPWGCDAYALFWNKDLFAAAGLDPERPPQTMEEMVEYAGKLTLRDEQGALSQVGFVPGFPRSHADLYAGMFGGALYSGGGAELTANSQPVIDALNWQGQFYNQYGPEDLKDLISSFTPYMTSRHPRYAGKRLDCRQCHRSLPIQNGKTPEAGFLQGRVAMMLGGQWLVNSNGLSGEEPPVNYGLAPFPPPAAHPERAGTAVVQGPVVILPAGAMDKEAAANLLAWMMSPQVLAEAAYGNAMLPTGRTAAQDSRFQEIAGFKVFIDLMDGANAAHTVTTPISPELNEALGRVESELLPQGGDPAPLLSEVQAQLAATLQEAWAYHGRR